MSVPSRFPFLYAITDRRLAGGRSHAELVRLLAAGGARLIQMREKELADGRRLTEARAAVDAAHAAGARLVMNDRADLAVMAGCDGVHVGTEDIPPDAARAIVGPSALVGCSTHSVEEAVKADGFPVDYIALGPIFATQNASVSRAPLGLEALSRVAAACRKPVVAIGGFDLPRAKEALAAGAASVAVMGDLMTAHDIAERARAYLDLA